MTSRLGLLCAGCVALLSACVYYPQGAYYPYPGRPSYPGYYGPGAGAPYGAPPPYVQHGPPPPTPYSEARPDGEPPVENDVAREEHPAKDEAPANQPSPDVGPPPPAANAPGKTPGAAVQTAIRTNRPGRVKSPYPPHNELDVTGMTSGSLAKDPATGQIFRVP